MSPGGEPRAMRRPACSLVLGLAVLLVAALAAPGPVAAVRIGPIEVDQVPGIAVADDLAGYADYRFRVTNLDARGHVVTLLLPAGEFSYGPLRQLRRTVELAPGGQAVVSLLQPPLPLYSGAVSVLVDGARQDEHLGVSTGYSRSGNGRHLLLSGAIPRDDLAILDNRLYTLTVADGPTSSWTEDWLGFTGFHGLVIMATEVAAMSAATRSALARFVEAGGSVLVLGAGAGALPLPDLAFSAPSELCGRRLRCTAAGFGELVTTPLTSVTELQPDEVARLELSWQQGSEALTKQRQGAVINRSFPVGPAATVPVRGLFLLMLGFVLLLGPVNIRWVSRRGRRMWLLWTVPALSLLTCLGVFGFALLSEGLTRYERAEGLTLLDQGQRRAISLGRVAFYSPLTPGRGLHFSYATSLTPDLTDAELNNTTGRTVDWSRDQHLARGWVVARVPCQLVVRKNESRRERLVLQRDGGALQVVNGLGAGIRRLWLGDGLGNPYEASEIAAGAVAELRAGDFKPAPAQDPEALRRLFATSWLQADKELVEHPGMWLAAGSYFAELDAWPFLEEALEGVSSRRRSLVLGHLEATP